MLECHVYESIDDIGRERWNSVFPREVETFDYPVMGFAPPADIRTLVAGYYGRPNSYYYRSYYGSEGGALWDAYSRLPYACGFYGYC